MTKRLALTPAVGLFAGLSVVSFGAVNVLLNGVHGSPRASSNACSTQATQAPATTTAAAAVRPGARARSPHPAGMPVLLADAVRVVTAARHSGTRAAADAGTGARAASQSASQSSPPLPSTSPAASPTPPVLPQPSPGQSATPAPTVPQPAPAKSTSKSPTISPGGTVKSSTATATPTPTATPTATPTPTKTATPPPSATLCLTVHTLDGVSSVDPHGKVRYAIWVWLTSGKGGTAKITLQASPSSVQPTFSVCAVTGQSSCTVGGLSAGVHVEVQAKLKAPGSGHSRVRLTASASSAEAANSASASDTVSIRAKSSPSPTPTDPGTAGDGGALPPAGLSGDTTVPGLGTQPTGDLGSAFPQVSPSAQPGATASQQAHAPKVVDLSAGLPLDVRLIGGQVIGLAVLAAAVTIAVARLSLRRQSPQNRQDSSGS